MLDVSLSTYFVSFFFIFAAFGKNETGAHSVKADSGHT